MHRFTHVTATGQQPGVRYHAQTDARSLVAIPVFSKKSSLTLGEAVNSQHLPNCTCSDDMSAVRIGQIATGSR